MNGLAVFSNFHALFASCGLGNPQVFDILLLTFLRKNSQNIAHTINAQSTIFICLGNQQSITRVHIARPCKETIAGFEEVKPMVFASIAPIAERETFLKLCVPLWKSLQLNDASLTFQPESSLALGFGPITDPGTVAHGNCTGTP